MKQKEIEQRCETLVLPILEENHFELWDVEYVKEGSNYYLRVYIDKENGINIDDCVQVSHALEAKLDAEDFIEEAYILEVSSPGLGRPLKRTRDFEHSINKAVDIKLYKAIDKCKEFSGVLVAFDEKSVTIRYEDQTEHVFQKTDLAMIRLSFDF